MANQAIAAGTVSARTSPLAEPIAAIIRSPIKLDLLQILHGAEPHSPAQLLELLPDPRTKQTINDHLRELEASGWVHVVRREQRRGCHEQYWGLTPERAQFDWTDRIRDMNGALLESGTDAEPSASPQLLSPLDAALGSPQKTVSVRLPQALWTLLSERAESLAQETSSGNAPSARLVLTEAIVRALDDPDLAAHAARVLSTAHREATAKTQLTLGCTTATRTPAGDRSFSTPQRGER